MNDRRTTNILLFLIFAALLLNILVKVFPIKNAIAESFKLDSCITTNKYAKPPAYLHVVPHDIPADY